MDTPSEKNDVLAQFQDVQNDIRAACKSSARLKEAVKLLAVSKFHEADRIRPVLKAGHRVFGENRVQEAQGKWPALRTDYPDVELHLIGPLQSNKVKQAVQIFDVIESVDREKLARALAREFQAADKYIPIYIQINTGEEPQKAGVLPKDAADFIDLCQNELGLQVKGLMCIPPVDEESALHFALLSKIAKQNGLEGLSMGMSGDWQTAIALGATVVRLGTAIFGQR